ncbi:cysteine desulfurase family protein [Planococcus faecalis]|uniref:cysteine desulfurase n=1 Tax=Planococcus faecalis TaxID=1598147 RepID=A0ABM6IRZ1_9BACL|nr:cysteine desulfurase family protein [Planococcus faecalis]AQU79097.1 cysteine desulfurase NifS [Planococcus faecalis]OHX51741.1 cysteine desulfurase NifS [Planococcus faecalis]
MNRIYLDHAATSPMHPEVVATFSEALGTVYGNPSSIHGTGRAARKKLDDARKLLADSIHAHDHEIIFTSGGTEADNTAIFGTAAKKEGKHIITTMIEHHAILHACEELERQGYDVTYLPVGENGRVRAEDVKNALRDDTILVSVMMGNNEVGTIQPIAEIGELLKDTDVTFHTDAVQAFGILPIDVNVLNVDLLSVSAHKLNGPKGVGFLYQRKGTAVTPLLYGGEQERKRRAGTENVPAISAFAKAVEIALATMEEKTTAYEQYKTMFKDVLDKQNVNYKENGSHSMPHILNLSISGIEIESFLINLDLAGISASSGSACTAGSIDPSHVLVAMYGDKAVESRNSIRFSFGLGLTSETIKQAAEKTAQISQRLALK